MTTRTTPAYVHGYSTDEAHRLGDQADALADLLHDGTAYARGSRVLEAGCGVGAQTAHLVTRSPGVRLTALDISASSLDLARARVTAAAPGADVTWRRADVRELPYENDTFDHVFVCFLLEHLADPRAALGGLRRVLRPGGTITVIEGDHGSAFFAPDSDAARAAIDGMARVQGALGGDAFTGRRLQPLLDGAGFADVRVEPRVVYADATRPALRDGFVRRTFVPVIAAAGDDAVAAGLATREAWDRGIADLYRTAEDGGTFHYTFMKATATAP
ncbi:class I SAM-dependent methyltransferase [Streptomyces avicenniae]|uniref:class I SAM-dependent methyltransferase n=1 Tax=Streptomyces avicenniae TaxID=500153 RepID=UPI00069B7FAF|nr:class I SAM-dependent methyltransferase [Streptomyces avicenniae]